MQFLEEFQNLFTAYLYEHRFDRKPTELYEPVNYIMHLGGKRIRPMLTLLGYQIFKPDIKKALPLALATEIFHNFSLVHDDIMDEAPLRRGKPTVHVKYNLNSGILSGDAMLILAYEYLSRFPEPSLIPKLYSVFNRTALEVCEGQQMDINFETRTEVSIPEYLKMIELKTAALIGGGLELGAIGAGASEEAVAHLAGFGRNIGIAFQLQDDILDTFGDPQKVGKKVGGDIVQNKKTFLIIKALERAKPDQNQQLLHWMTNSNFNEDEKVKAVIDLMNQLDIKKLALEAKEQFQQKGLDHLEAVSVPEEKKKSLRKLADSLLIREF